jgi:hypothetical protein
MEIFAVAEPDELVAVMAYPVTADTAVGVPEMVPADGSSDRPAGSAGLTE